MSNPCFDPVDINEMRQAVDECNTDLEILEQMENAVQDRNKLEVIMEYVGPIDPVIRERTLGLPPVVREAAVHTYYAFKHVRDHYQDVLDMLASEYIKYDGERKAMSQVDLRIYKTLPGKYRNSFARSRNFWRQRKLRTGRRMTRVKAKIDYLNKHIVEHNCQIPDAPLPCDLCAIGGEGFMTLPKEQAVCSNIECKFVTCTQCFGKLKKEVSYGAVPKCPGCRAKFQMRGGTHVVKKDDNNPFDVISDEELSETDGESDVDLQTFRFSNNDDEEI